MPNTLNSSDFKSFCLQQGFRYPSTSIKALTAYFETHKEAPPVRVRFS